MSTPELLLYGAFDCPWSLLASRRAALLEHAGLRVDWRAVERSGTPDPTDEPFEFATLRAEAEKVLGWLLPDEPMPYTLAGFATRTGAAVGAYAEIYPTEWAATAREVLFDAFWTHALDLADPAVVRTLLADAVGGLPARDGDRVIGIGRRRVRRWAAERQSVAGSALPVLVLTRRRLSGPAAVEWLGRELLRRGVELNPDPARASAHCPTCNLAVAAPPA